MNADQLIEEWGKDAEFTTDLADDTRNIVNLHTKYYGKLSRARRKLRSEKDELEAMRHIKELYFLGKADPSVYRDKPFNIKVPKGELPMWISSDKEWREKKHKVDGINEIVTILEEIVKQINNRNFLIKNIIEFRIFEAGGR